MNFGLEGGLVFGVKRIHFIWAQVPKPKAQHTITTPTLTTSHISPRTSQVCQSSITEDGLLPRGQVCEVLNEERIEEIHLDSDECDVDDVHLVLVVEVNIFHGNLGLVACY